mmetsp:Transcript_18535/g.54217  ORF Transcript_18535/g.54217 Transcript_18535/m.54217 type:complete len:315 (+) Transcript_18535:82-1026(+)
MTASTGPKISVRIASWSIMPGGSSRMVGPTQVPPPPSLAQGRPSRRTLAPSFSAWLTTRRIFSWDAASMTGPTQPPSWPLCSDLAFATTLATSSGWAPMVMSTEAAMHRWPEQPAKEATMSEAAISTSLSGAATRWFLAPPRAMAFLPAARALLYTSSATRDEPTKVSAWMPGWSQSAFTTSTSPCTIWKAPGGTPASASRSAVLCMVRGTFSLGLRITQLPATRAMGMVQKGTMKGKLKGTMLATTPTGSRISWHVTPELTVRWRPCASCGMEHAHSTVSRPLATSPAASTRFLPFSFMMSSMSSSLWASTRE